MYRNKETELLGEKLQFDSFQEDMDKFISFGLTLLTKLLKCYKKIKCFGKEKDHQSDN